MTYELGLKFEAASEEEARLIAEYMLLAIVNRNSETGNVFDVNSDLSINIPQVYQVLRELGA